MGRYTDRLFKPRPLDQLAMDYAIRPRAGLLTVMYRRYGHQHSKLAIANAEKILKMVGVS